MCFLWNMLFLKCSFEFNFLLLWNVHQWFSFSKYKMTYLWVVPFLTWPFIEFPFLWNVPAIYPIKSFIFLHIKCLWNFLFIKFPLSEMSFMRNILSIKFPIFEMSYLWNVLPKNCPIYELSCLWNVLSIKYPFYEMSQHLRKCILIKFLLTVLSLIN